MPHVDDGTLHALLDGALDSGDRDRAAAVRAHLASCGDCAARLDQEAALRDRAASVLGALEPEAVRPDFDEVLIRAARDTDAPAGTGKEPAGRGHVPARWSRSLAWAATVVVALGTGYLMGQRFGFPAPGQAPRISGPAARAATESAPAGTGQSQKAGTRADVQTEALPLASRPATSASGGAAANAENGAPAPVAEDRAVAARTASPAGQEAGTASPAEQEAGAASPQRVPALPESAPERREALAALSDAQKAMPDSASPSIAGSVQLNAIVVTGMGARTEGDAGSWRPVDRGEAAHRLGGHLLRLPGAELGALDALGDAPAAPVRSAQRLPSGVVVTVTQFPVSWAEDEADSLSAPAREGGTAGETRVVLSREDGITLVLAGPLSLEQLLRLGRAAGPID